ncbi:heavy-metal-associated domain-containing protein [Corynebacterium aquatimens]|uniref:Copper chaperone CopZ n=1 Tax=Corynebacterium aquatimens TaxID=1190508 RepID=A0A931GWN0_9CORY|nr:heavy-metal-associated domain-containing protein [Corynebacterium aquatimens]MBG6122791.1 copper chaperone CopZ [Corynebacterium aquatimens]WJY66874.1 Copper chaperone CopZ [Corynebacterium aquatimens]
MAQREFDVEGMTCAHCEASVVEEVSEVAGVESATADHASGKLVVTGEGFSAAEISKAVSEAGYTLA